VQPTKDGEIVRITSGSLAGALVAFHFVNVLGNLDCRFYEDFGPHRKGEIVVVRPEQAEAVQ
jgi:hypothetical protein